MRFLTCEPNLAGKSDRNDSVPYLDEADRFYLDHESWFRNNSEYVHKTTRLVLFENLYQQLANTYPQFVENFPKCEKFYHSPVKISSRIDNYMYLCTRQEYLPEEFSKIEL